MIRINAVGLGCVKYLSRGCGCTHDRDRDRAPELGGPEDKHQHEQQQERGGPEREREGRAARYFAAGVEHGEPAGRWWGSGIEALGLDFRPGDTAAEADVEAIFGELRYPWSTAEDPVHIGSKPRSYKSGPQRLEAALAAEPDASPERRRELERKVGREHRKPVGYYDITFSPAKSISVYYAALLAAGAHDEAAKIVAAHERAVEIALAYGEREAAYIRTGDHGRSADGRSVGRYEWAVGWVAVLYRHSTSRESEPQLHTHGAVLNRAGTEGGQVGAVYGRGFRPIIEAMGVAYDRAVEQLVTEASGAVFEWRPDGLAREIVGVDPQLCAEASTRRGQVEVLLDQLIAGYVERNGHQPDAAARKAMAQYATLETRRPKDELAGPAGVAAWGLARRERCEATVEAVAEVAAAAAEAAEQAQRAGEPVAGMAIDPASGRGDGQPAVMDRAALLAAAVADVQAAYATWTRSNLVQAIHRRLVGAPAELGVAADQQGAAVDALAGEALRAGNRYGVVCLTAPDLVAVPEELRRTEDGRSPFREHIDERYATATQLDTEQGLVVGARQLTAPTVGGPRLELLRVELAAAGLSPDQVDAVAGVLVSGRAGDVLIGPAGSGKSHTLGQLARVWGEEHGGRVLGLATAEAATRNLRGLGIDALNTTRFRMAYTPDPTTGLTREQLHPGDLVVLDEAGMAATTELAAVAEIVAAAGAKLLYTGDHHQLTSVGAGGMLEHLARENGAFELAEVHRFANDWEGDASLRLRAGDQSAVAEYADRGRLRAGTLEEMQEAAMRGWLADTVAGKQSLLIVGSNAHAAELSRSIRDQLIALGRVDPATLMELADRNQVGVGDVIQARLNDHRLRVDPQVGPDGRAGPALPVTNKETYTVVGRGPAGELLARDERGAIAHLPTGYVQENVTLAYAVTGQAAQGLTVDTAHPIHDRGATREWAYPASTRGRESNTLYLVTEREPDKHTPERISEQAAERLATILNTSSGKQSASHVQALSTRAAGELSMVGELWAQVGGDAAQERTSAALSRLLGPDLPAQLRGEPGYRGLLHAVRAAELAGHHTDRLLQEAVDARPLAGVGAVSDVLVWRIQRALERREPEQQVDPADWTTRAAPVDGPVGQYLQELAVLASDRQAHLARQAAAAAPEWATTHLGPVPPVDDLQARAEWERRAGVAAAYRELQSIPADQVSLGAAPAPRQETHRALWEAAAEALGRSDDAVDVHALSDVELYATRERWTREQAWAPEWVAGEMATAYQLASDYQQDAQLDAAQLRAMHPTDPARHDRAEAVARAERLAAHFLTHAQALEGIHAARQHWYETSRDVRQADQAAAEELARRNLPPQRQAEQRQVDQLDEHLERRQHRDERQVDERQVDEQRPERIEAPLERDAAGPAPEREVPRADREVPDVDRDRVEEPRQTHHHAVDVVELALADPIGERPIMRELTAGEREGAPEPSPAARDGRDEQLQADLDAARASLARAREAIRIAQQERATQAAADRAARQAEQAEAQRNADDGARTRRGRAVQRRAEAERQAEQRREREPDPAEPRIQRTREPVPRPTPPPPQWHPPGAEVGRGRGH